MLLNIIQCESFVWYWFIYTKRLIADTILINFNYNWTFEFGFPLIVFFFSSIFSLIVWVYQTVLFFSSIKRKTNYNRKFNMALLNATIWTFLINLFFPSFLCSFPKLWPNISAQSHYYKNQCNFSFSHFFFAFRFFRTCILILDTFYHFV